MVATVEIRQRTGGSDGSPGNSDTITATTGSTRLQTADSFAPADETNPVPIPGAGLKYSYWIHVHLEITVAPSVKINNIRHYTDGAIGWNFGTSGRLVRGNRDAGDKGAPMPSEYDVATGTTGDTGDSISDGTSGHDYFNGQTTKVVDVEGDTVGTPATIDSTDHTTTESCKAIVMQVEVDTDATQGEQSDETQTWKYDEI